VIGVSKPALPWQPVLEAIKVEVITAVACLTVINTSWPMSSVTNVLGDYRHRPLRQDDHRLIAQHQRASGIGQATTSRKMVATWKPFRAVQLTAGGFAGVALSRLIPDDTRGASIIDHRVFCQNVGSWSTKKTTCGSRTVRYSG